MQVPGKESVWTQEKSSKFLNANAEHFETVLVFAPFGPFLFKTPTCKLKMFEVRKYTGFV